MNIAVLVSRIWFYASGTASYSITLYADCQPKGIQGGGKSGLTSVAGLPQCEQKEHIHQKINSWARALLTLAVAFTCCMSKKEMTNRM